jgi:hypothetical protein
MRASAALTVFMLIQEPTMHPRIVFAALAGVAFDLLCLFGAAAVLLTNNIWLDEVGATRFLYVVLLVGFALVPLMYALEVQGAARRIGERPERVGASLPAWAGVDRTVRA